MDTQYPISNMKIFSSGIHTTPPHPMPSASGPTWWLLHGAGLGGVNPLWVHSHIGQKI